jgi:hypothetical protein
VILGRQWAESEGIHTAADRAKLATKEHQNLAEWAANATKPKTKVNITKQKTDTITELRIEKKTLRKR